MTCPDFTRKLYEMMGWDPKCRYKILGYKIDFEGETYYVFDLLVKETFREKPKKGEAATEPVDTRKGYYSDDIAGTFGVPLEEHKKQTQVTVEQGYINVAMLTGDKKHMEADGTQLPLNVAPAMPAPDSIDIVQNPVMETRGEVRPDEDRLEVSDGTHNMGSQ